MAPACTYHLASPPPTGSAAIAIIELRGDIDRSLIALNIRPVSPGRAALRDWPNVDTVVLARFSATSALLFPHAGPAVLKKALATLDASGLRPLTDPSPQDQFPEAASVIEARILAALARAASPLAIDLLLDQPRRWSLVERGGLNPLPDESSLALNRLITPPLVVALGRPNIGKSTLLNALAGRAVSIVADIPGTTRDHVGVELNLAGLVVRYIDTPGISAPTGPTTALDSEAQSLALGLIPAADLILLCADATAPYLSLTPAPTCPTLRVALRADLGLPSAGSDVSISIHPHESRGLESLVQALRSQLVPEPLLTDQRAWKFW